MTTRRSPKSPRRTSARKGVLRRAPARAGSLTPLDQDRAASMADEGGRAAAEVEVEGGDRALEAQPLARETGSRGRSSYGLWALGLAAGLLVLAVVLRRR